MVGFIFSQIFGFKNVLRIINYSGLKLSVEKGGDRNFLLQCNFLYNAIWVLVLNDMVA